MDDSITGNEAMPPPKPSEHYKRVKAMRAKYAAMDLRRVDVWIHREQPTAAATEATLHLRLPPGTPGTVAQRRAQARVEKVIYDARRNQDEE